VVVAVTSSCDGSGDGETAKVEALLSGGGGSGHIMHPVMGDPPSFGFPCPRFGR
jgi:hypothetical protein